VVAHPDLEFILPAGEAAEHWERLVREAGNQLARSGEVSPQVKKLIRQLGHALEEVSQTELAHIDPYLLVALQRGAIQTLLSLGEEAPAAQRRAARLGLERMRQVLRDVAQEAIVSEDQPIKEVVRWLVDTLDAPHAEVAALLSTSPRTLQRWISPSETVQPHGEDAARVKNIARIVNQLRHGLTGQGVLRWFESPHPELKGRSPRGLLEDPRDAGLLTRLAATTRVSGAT
jgi:hypothetical protein